MPKVWSETIETHRRVVRDAILDTTATLVTEQGLLSVTMSQIAEDVGIGRATLYKYFPDVETILIEWHKRQVAEHLEQLRAVRDRAGDPADRLQAVLETFALMRYERSGTELEAVLHRGDHISHETQHLKDLIKDLLVEGAAAGQFRTDVAPDELANYCFHALSAAGALRSKAAARRLVTIVVAGLQPLS